MKGQIPQSYFRWIMYIGSIIIEKVVCMCNCTVWKILIIWKFWPIISQQFLNLNRYPILQTIKHSITGIRIKCWNYLGQKSSWKRAGFNRLLITFLPTSIPAVRCIRQRYASIIACWPIIKIETLAAPWRERFIR